MVVRGVSERTFQRDVVAVSKVIMTLSLKGQMVRMK